MNVSNKTLCRLDPEQKSSGVMRATGRWFLVWCSLFSASTILYWCTATTGIGPSVPFKIDWIYQAGSESLSLVSLQQNALAGSEKSSITTSSPLQSTNTSMVFLLDLDHEFQATPPSQTDAINRTIMVRHRQLQKSNDFRLINNPKIGTTVAYLAMVVVFLMIFLCHLWDIVEGVFCCLFCCHCPWFWRCILDDEITDCPSDLEMDNSQEGNFVDEEESKTAEDS